MASQTCYRRAVLEYSDMLQSFGWLLLFTLIDNLKRFLTIKIKCGILLSWRQCSYTRTFRKRSFQSPCRTASALESMCKCSSIGWDSQNVFTQLRDIASDFLVQSLSLVWLFWDKLQIWWVLSLSDVIDMKLFQVDHMMHRIKEHCCWEPVKMSCIKWSD